MAYIAMTHRVMAYIVMAFNYGSNGGLMLGSTDRCGTRLAAQGGRRQADLGRLDARRWPACEGPSDLTRPDRAADAGRWLADERRR